MNFKRTMMVLALLALGSAGAAIAADNVFFLHHSTGRNLIDEGDLRSVVELHNVGRTHPVEFWDHDYNSIGLRDPDGNYTGVSYGIPNDNTNPDGLYTLWTSDNPARTQILANHQIIAFKSCFPASDITSDAMLQQYKNWYLAMRDVFDQHPSHTFVVMSQPPLHRLATNTADAARARAFSRWLGSSAYLSGHDNVRFFDFFDRLAHVDDGSDQANRLNYAYERSHTNSDSHPNMTANQIVGPEFMQFLLELAEEITPNEEMSWGEVKTTYR